MRNYGAIGTAITLLSAELVGDFCGIYYVLKTKTISFPLKRMKDYFLASIPYILICFMIKPFGLNYILELLISAFGDIIIRKGFTIQRVVITDGNPRHFTTFLHPKQMIRSTSSCFIVPCCTADEY